MGARSLTGSRSQKIREAVRAGSGLKNGGSSGVDIILYLSWLYYTVRGVIE